MALTEPQIKRLELGFIFAGIQQYRRNLTGNLINAKAEPWLTNVSFQNPRYDPPTRVLLENSMEDFRAHRKAKRVLVERNKLIPLWAPMVRAKLDEQKIPFTGDLLWSPEINLDGVSPLYGPGVRPISLFNLTMGQQGESDFYGSINAIELMMTIFPLYWRYYHRPANSPAPWPGVTFGQPGNPIVATDLYKRWASQAWSSSLTTTATQNW